MSMSAMSECGGSHSPPGLSNELFFTTMVLNESELTEAVEKIKQHAPDYYSDNDEGVVVNPFFHPNRISNVEIIQRVNAVIFSEPLSTRTLKLLSIRAEVYNKLGKHRLALADCNEILKADTSQFSIIATKAEALVGLHMYEAARDFLKPYVALFSKSTVDIKTLYLKTCMFIVQSQFGEYPWKEILKRYRIEPGLLILDWADYEGHVTIKETSDGKGRGLYATKNITAGQLILATKAFGVFDNTLKPAKGVSINHVDTSETNNNEEEEVDTLPKQIIRNLRLNPIACKLFYKLYAGPSYVNVNPPVFSLLDTVNDFIDAKRIEEICEYNCLCDGEISGVWGLPSYLNHSCYDCNSGWLMYGDFLFVRAFKNIKEGDEITTSYVPLEGCSERMKALAIYGIFCNCTLCKFDRKEPESIQEEKAELLAKLKLLDTKVVGSRTIFTDQSIDDAVCIVKRLLELRPIYNIFLYPFLTKIAWYYYFANNLEKAFYYFVTSYNAMKKTSGLVFEAYEICNAIVEILLLDKQEEPAKKWFDILKNATLLAFGTLEVLKFALLEEWANEIEFKRSAKLTNGETPAASASNENGAPTEFNGNGLHTEE